MLKLLCAISLFVAVQAQAQEELITGRAAIEALMPAAVRVIEQIERDQGRRFTDDELPRVLKSTDFGRRLGEHVKDDPAFAPCRIVQCVSA